MNFDDKIFSEIGPCTKFKLGFHFWYWICMKASWHENVGSSSLDVLGENFRITGPQCEDDRQLFQTKNHGPLARYVELRAAHATGMHHGMCVTHVVWCMQGSLTTAFLWYRCRKNVPSILAACTTRNFMYLVRGPRLLKSLIWFRHVRGTWFNQESSCDGINQDDWYRLNAYES